MDVDTKRSRKQSKRKKQYDKAIEEIAYFSDQYKIRHLNLEHAAYNLEVIERRIKKLFPKLHQLDQTLELIRRLERP